MNKQSKDLATVITNLMSAIPWIGKDIVEFIWGGFSVNNATLNRFFSLHFLLPFVLAALALMHLIVLHDTAGSNNPIGISGNYDRLPFAPYYIFKDLITIFLFIFVISLFIFFMPNVLGDSENYVMANPMQTPPAIVPEWYLLPYYAILRSIPNKLLGVIAMFASILSLLVLIIADLSRSRGAQFRPITKMVFFGFVADFSVLMVIGAKHVEDPYILLGQLASFIYFLFFFVLFPFVTTLENTFIYLKKPVLKTNSINNNIKNMVFKINLFKPNKGNKRPISKNYLINKLNLTDYESLDKKQLYILKNILILKYEEYEEKYNTSSSFLQAYLRGYESIKDISKKEMDPLWLFYGDPDKRDFWVFLEDHPHTHATINMVDYFEEFDYIRNFIEKDLSDRIDYHNKSVKPFEKNAENLSKLDYLIKRYKKGMAVFNKSVTPFTTIPMQGDVYFYNETHKWLEEWMASSYFLTWEFVILCLAKNYYENKISLKPSDISSVHKEAFEIWRSRQFFFFYWDGEKRKFKMNDLLKTSNYIPNYTKDDMLYQEICNDLIFVECNLLLSKDIMEYIWKNKPNFTFFYDMRSKDFDQKTFDKDMDLIFKEHFQKYSKGYQTYMELNLWRLVNNTSQQTLDENYEANKERELKNEK